MANQFNLLDNIDFKAAVNSAKQICKKENKTTIDCRLLLIGFLTVIENGEGNTEELLSCKDLIQNSLEMTVSEYKFDPKKLMKNQLDTDANLRDVIRDDYQDISGFVKNLVDKHNELKQDASDIISEIITASRHLDTIETEIDEALFGLTAYYLFKTGKFRNNLLLTILLSSNKLALDALMSASCNDGTTLKLIETKQNIIKQTVIDRFPNKTVAELCEIVDISINAGNSLLENRSTAIHEAGHAVASFLLRPHQIIKEISILKFGDYSGVTIFDGRLNSVDNKTKYKKEICVCYAGGIAEQIYGGDQQLSAGTYSDFKGALSKAWQYLADLGLDEKFGPINLNYFVEMTGIQSGFIHDEAQKRLREFLIECFNETRQLLSNNWHHVENLANKIIERRRISHYEIVDILVDRSIIGEESTVLVRCKEHKREVTFADSDGVCDTNEGPVRYSSGDAILTGAKGEIWPVGRDKFESLYRPIDPALKMGSKGEYVKIEREVHALQVKGIRNVILSNGRGILYAMAGDWVVDYGDGDLSVVSGSLFDLYYCIV